ncbi:MAG TPA: TolC family protein [Bacteroidales bacterium]|nr:TolC family protein [Bacteroidales bacterium]
MKQTLYKSALIALLLLLGLDISAQTDTISNNYYVEKPIDYNTYLNLIIDNNLSFAAEKFNVDIAEANVKSAHSFPDPELSFEGTDNGERRMKMGYEFAASLDWTLELGGKRKARIELAKSESEVSKSLLEDFFRNLRAEATLKYLIALRNERLYNSQLEAYNNMQEIARADSLRYQFGEISEVTARQSKLEARTIFNSVLEAESEYQNSMLDLMLLVNKQPGDTILKPIGDFDRFNRDFLLQDLIITAQNNRSDFLAALQNKSVAKRLIDLERANRKIDLGLSVGVEYASYVRNVVAPTPSHTPVSVGISIPLKFSNKHNSELRIAKFNQQQIEYEYAQIENQIEIGVIQAFRQYNSMRRQLKAFNDGILEEAKSILDGRIYSYKRGENSLLEVLDAQRTYNEIQQNYHDTLFKTAAALVELEKSAGIWDIAF